MKHSTNFASLSSLLAIVLFFFACQKDLSKPAPTMVELEDPTPGNSTFIIVSDHVTETADGMQFKGSLSTKTDEGQEFLVAEGEFKVVTGADGAVKSFSGTGMPQFPRVGLFAEMLKTFTWKFIKAHVEYEKGSYYVNKYSTDVPLDPERRYIHFKVFDETKDGEFELRNIANKILYKFNDLYIDPLDPAVLFKVQLTKPNVSQATAPGNIVTGFWSKVKNMLTTIGGPAINYISGPQLIIGVSNQAKFNSQPYPFKVTDAESFKSKFGFNTFEAMPSHYFFKVSGIPIPSTGVLRFKGDAYVHSPFKTLIPEVTPRETIEDNYNAVLDWINNEENNGYSVTMNGAIDPGAKGIGAILSALPYANSVLGQEVFSKDLDIDLVGATLQFQVPGINQVASGQVPSFLRFGIEIKTPILADIFGESIKKYLVSFPGTSNFLYFSLGPTAEEMSFYTESGAKMVVPYFGELNLGHSQFSISKEGIELQSSRHLDLGPIHIESDLKGKLSPEGFSLTGKIDRNITLPGDVELAAKRFDITVDSKKGIALDGEVVLPFGLGEAAVSGSITTNEVALSGNLRAGTVIDLGNGLQLPTANMKFTFSSNANKGLELEGDVNIPYVGMVSVKGKVNKNDFLLEGKASTAQITFGTVALPYANSAISISKTNGIRFSALFNLGPFGSRSLEGMITATQIKLNGHFNASIPIGGHSFSFANAAVTADNSGVKISGLIDLYAYKVQVSGSFHGANNFSLTGQTTYNVALVKATIKATVSSAGVSMTATGQIFGPLGNELFSGTLKVVPNWAAKTISVCYTALGQELCLTL